LEKWDKISKITAFHSGFDALTNKKYTVIMCIETITRFEKRD